MMKKLLIIAAMSFAGFLKSEKLSAQNSIQFNYGFKKPVGNKISDAFKSNGGETISFMHQLNKSKWAIGATFNQQKFQSNDNYFKDDFKASMSIYNAMFSLRKKMFLEDDHYWYWGVDLGMAFDKFYKSKPEPVSEKNIGFTKGFVLGSVWRINEVFAIDLNGAYHNTYADDMNYNNQFTASRFKYVSLNLGVRYEFKL